MERPCIFVTWPMEPAARAILEAAGDVATSDTENELAPPELARRAAEAVIPTGAHRVAASVIDAAPRLRVIAVAALRGERPPDLVNPDAWGSPPKV